jgi:hypothetical protein
MKYPQGSVGLGVLSWRGHQSLRQALASYKKEDFFSLFDDALIFLPDPDEHVQKVVSKYPLRVETSPENKGILSGMEEIANRLTTDYIFFTENDCPLVEKRNEADRQIKIALELLQDGRACMARMRHVEQPGEKFETLHKYKRMHPTPDTFISGLRRVFRPAKAHRLSGTAIYGETHPEQKFPQSIESVGDGFYLVNSGILPWTNQSILIKRNFFRDTILPFCKSTPSKRTANGFQTLEIELNRSNFWTKSGWKIACGPGLLTHNRVNDRGY